MNTGNPVTLTQQTREMLDRESLNKEVHRKWGFNVVFYGDGNMPPRHSPFIRLLHLIGMGGAW